MSPTTRASSNSSSRPPRAWGSRSRRWPRAAAATRTSSTSAASNAPTSGQECEPSTPSKSGSISKTGHTPATEDVIKLAQQIKLLLVAAVLLSAIPLDAGAQRRVPRAPSRRAAQNDVERKVEALLARMTLEEKLGQLQQSGGDVAGKANPDLFEAARAGRLGSTLGIRGAKNANELQRAAGDGSGLKVRRI